MMATAIVFAKIDGCDRSGTIAGQKGLDERGVAKGAWLGRLGGYGFC